MKLDVGQKLVFKLEGVLTLENSAMTMAEARAQLEAAGTKILSQDDEKRTFRVMQEEREVRILQAVEVPDDNPAAVLGIPGAAEFVSKP